MQEKILDFISSALAFLVVLALSWVIFVLLIWAACWCFGAAVFTVRWSTGLWICASLVKLTLCPGRKDKK